MVQAAWRIAFFALMLAVASSEAHAASARLDEVKVSTEDDATVVLLHTTRVPRYTAELIDSPSRLVLDLEDTAYAWRNTPLAVATDPIKAVRGSQFRKDRARVVIELTRRAGFVVREDTAGLAIMIPTTTPTASPDTSMPRESLADSSARTRATSAGPVVGASAAQSSPTAATEARDGNQTAAGAVDPPAESPRIPTPTLAQAAPAPPAPASPARPTAQITSRPANGGRLISLDFKEADVVNLLRILAAESGRNIVIGEDVKGKVSISLRNVPWEQALETILESRGLVKIEKGDVIRIVSNEQLAKEREAAARVEEAKLKSEADVRTKLAEASLKEAEAQARKIASEAAQKELEARGPLREETVRLSYADPEEVENTLKGILGIPKEGTKVITGVPTVLGSVPLGGVPPVVGVAPPNPELPAFMQPGPQPLPALPATPTSVSQDVLNKGLTIRAHKPTNTIFLRLYARDLEIVKKLIRESLDVPLPQVKIEARMEILDRTALENIGVQWGGGTVQPAGGQTLVGQGLQTTQNQGQIVPVFPGFVTPDNKVPGIGDFTSAVGLGSANRSINPTSLLTAALPVSSLTGLPLGGNVVNLPPQFLSVESLAQAAAGGITFGLIGSRYNINLALQALSNQGKTRTLARPEIVTVENAKAAMSLGEEIPFATVSSAGTQIQFKEALLKLEVTPTVIREPEANRIKMIVVVENNNRGDTVNLGASGSPPAINRRKAETQVIIREGDRLVIGGVASNTNRNTVRKVPVLGDVPMLGWLFKSKEDFETGRELVVFVTPTILRGPSATAALPPPPPSPIR